MQHISNLDYLAGFFDGEGSISLIRPRRKKKGGARNPSFVLSCAISQVNPLILFEIQRRYGGYVGYNNSSRIARPIWALTITARKAEKFLRDLLPKLRLKRAEAHAVLNYQKLIGIKWNGRPVPRKLLERRFNALQEFDRVRTIARSAIYPSGTAKICGFKPRYCARSLLR